MISFRSLSTWVQPKLKVVPIGRDAFRRICSKFATGVAVATVLDAEGAPHGLTVNSFTSVSCDPPLVLICIDYDATVFPQFRAARHFGINVLSEEQRDLSVRFAERGRDRFNGTSWVAGTTGVPLLPGVLASLECEVAQVVEAGDHAVFIARLVDARVSDGRPLLYFDSGYRSISEPDSR